MQYHRILSDTIITSLLSTVLHPSKMAFSAQHQHLHLHNTLHCSISKTKFIYNLRTAKVISMNLYDYYKFQHPMAPKIGTLWSREGGPKNLSVPQWSQEKILLPVAGCFLTTTCFKVYGTKSVYGPKHV